MARATGLRGCATIPCRSSDASRSAWAAGAEKVTLKLVAKYADMNNVGGGIDAVRHKEAILLEHCATVGRDPAEIERSTGIGVIFIRDDRAEAERGSWPRSNATGSPALAGQPVGTPEDVAEMLAPYVALGYRRLVPASPPTTTRSR